MKSVSTFKRSANRATLAMGLAAMATVIAAPAYAQADGADESMPPLPELPSVGVPSVAQPLTQSPMSPQEVQSLPAEYRVLPAETETTTIGADGVETITRTRRIPVTAPVVEQTGEQVTYAYPAGQYAPVQYAPVQYAPVTYAAPPAVFDRASWLAECRRRTEGLNRKDRAGIIGGLIGAIGGGILGNRIADGNRLLGTALGVGAGAAAGALVGNAIDGRRDDDDYNCEDVLESYLSQPPTVYQSAPVRVASRTIAAPAPAPVYAYQGYAPQQYAPAYGYSYGYAPAFSYAQTQQTVLVPVQTMQQQRVLVRETVREELVPAVRSIPRPAPVRAPIPIKGPAPSPKMIKN